MATYRQDLPELPIRMRHLPLDERGYPVPWFVGYVNGKPDFRAIKPNGIASAYKGNTCWLCGHPLGTYKACVVGPMCGVNRITSEPASHLECAEYAARACPFLTRPLASRNERDMPEGSDMAGIGIKRNPGACLIWITKQLKPFKVNNGILFELGPPTQITFWTKGRRATRAEIDQAVGSGLPLLAEYAKRDGPAGEAHLKIMYQKWLDLANIFLPDIPKAEGATV